MSERTADPADVEAVLLLMRRMGVRPEDLRVEPGPGAEPDPPSASSVPTFADIVPKAAAEAPAPSRRIYGPYWDRIVLHWGDRRIDQPTAADVRWLFEWVRETRLKRRNSNGGHGAVLHTYHALQIVYRYCVNEQLLTPRQNVMTRVRRPPKPPSTRHAISPQLYEQIDHVARTTGTDRKLDALLVRFHLETAARVGGALALTLGDLDEQQCLVHLHEKNSKSRWQPVSRTLMRALVAHAHERGAREHTSRVLRFKNGNPITKKKYENLWKRIGKHVDSVATLGISTHWLRHTVLTWVERNFGPAVARAYAGHAEPSSSRQGVTDEYVKASLTEVATALQALTGERHPLAEVLPTGFHVDAAPLGAGGSVEVG